MTASFCFCLLLKEATWGPVWRLSEESAAENWGSPGHHWGDTTPFNGSTARLHLGVISPIAPRVPSGIEPSRDEKCPPSPRLMPFKTSLRATGRQMWVCRCYRVRGENHCRSEEMEDLAIKQAEPSATAFPRSL